jgi:hypothetical protein
MPFLKDEHTHGIIDHIGMFCLTQSAPRRSMNP